MSSEDTHIENTEETAEERAHRVRMLKGAYAAFNDERSAIPCMVRNMSETGAQLLFNGGWYIPEEFTLHVEIDGYKVDCERMWFKGDLCGVKFIGPRIRIGKRHLQVLTPDLGKHETEETVPQQPMAKYEVPVREGPRRTGGFGKRTR